MHLPSLGCEESSLLGENTTFVLQGGLTLWALLCFLERTGLVIFLFLCSCIAALFVFSLLSEYTLLEIFRLLYFRVVLTFKFMQL